MNKKSMINICSVIVILSCVSSLIRNELTYVSLFPILIMMLPIGIMLLNNRGRS